MKKSAIMLFTALMPIYAMQAQQADHAKVEVYTLSNGMQVWLNEDHTSPTVMGMVAVRAGAKDCPDTGIAHYFEHIMFKGTDKIGTVDYSKEKPLLDSIAEQYRLLKENGDPQVRRDIQARINELSVEAAKYAVPNEFANLITMFGGSSLNAGTGQDMTSYYNVFSSQNIIPWLELNSERLANPVYRLFQSELETVYEEKNMYSDDMMWEAFEHIQDAVFAPHPYSKPILGATEHLKNPDLDAMEEFYRTYYVAGNMALLLSGDFDTQSILPEIERCFSRIPAGTPEHIVYEQPRQLDGREVLEVKVPIPLVKLGGIVWHTIPVNDPDEAAMNVASLMLSNENGTGYFDRLMKGKEVLMASGMNISMNDAGMYMALYVPKMAFTGVKKAEAAVLGAIDKIKDGRFSEEDFESARMEYLKDRTIAVENSIWRVSQMADVFSSGQTWEQYLDNENRIRELTRDDIVAVANKYLGDDMLVLKKEKGSYPKDRLEKPGFAPIKPQTEVKYSEYAKALMDEYMKPANPRFIEIGNDIDMRELGRGNSLFHVRNPYNDIFTLELSFPAGYDLIPGMEAITQYLGFTGTDSMTNIEFNEKLRMLGSSIWYGATKDNFRITIQGFDEHLGESYALLVEFLNGVRDDKAGINSLVKSKGIDDKAFRKDAGSMASLAVRHTLYGKNSYDWRQPTKSELKRDGKRGDLLRDFKKITEYTPNIYYAGQRSAEEVAEMIEADPAGGLSSESEKIWFDTINENQGSIYTYDIPKSRQSYIYSYFLIDDLTNERDRHLARLFNSYLGGSMGSVIFREIREYRSLAYQAGSGLTLPRMNWGGEKAGVLLMVMTTQLDKTEEAVAVLDSLMHNMEFSPEDVRQAVIHMSNNINNNYPSFRHLARSADSFLREGYSEDPNRLLFEDLEGFTVADLQEFYERNIKDKPQTWVIVTDTKKFDPAKLAPYGEVVRLKDKDLFRE